eukprot:2399875-Prymnesium_polylepis.1
MLFQGGAGTQAAPGTQAPRTASASVPTAPQKIGKTPEVTGRRRNWTTDPLRSTARTHPAARRHGNSRFGVPAQCERNRDLHLTMHMRASLRWRRD